MRKVVILSFLFAILIVSSGFAAAQNDVVTSAIQYFEGGMMIWRGDTGAIWVLMDDGLNMTIPEITYKDWEDISMRSMPPRGHYVPTRGFGRVWGNIVGVREQLGYATIPEISFDLRIMPIDGGVEINLDDGQLVNIFNSGVWAFAQDTFTPPTTGMVTPVSSLPASTITPATVQYFEHGLMMYWRDTGSIWVLENNSSVTHYPSETYGMLSANPVTANAPEGYWKPAFGIGKVWGHFLVVRNALGWATDVEHAYTMTFNRSYAPGFGARLHVSLPDGQIIVISDLNRWYYAN